MEEGGGLEAFELHFLTAISLLNNLLLQRMTLLSLCSNCSEFIERNFGGNVASTALWTDSAVWRSAVLTKSMWTSLKMSCKHCDFLQFELQGKAPRFLRRNPKCIFHVFSAHWACCDAAKMAIYSSSIQKQFLMKNWLTFSYKTSCVYIKMAASAEQRLSKDLTTVQQSGKQNPGSPRSIEWALSTISVLLLCLAASMGHSSRSTLYRQTSKFNKRFGRVHPLKTLIEH